MTAEHDARQMARLLIAERAVCAAVEVVARASDDDADAALVATVAAVLLQKLARSQGVPLDELVRRVHELARGLDAAFSEMAGEEEDQQNDDN
jgi:hypothetical protein